ncbi:MAG TPA: DMT family transporter [Actinomycetales bacterium]|jgi:drug/metabolite transporter (DMT)-like permease|nr:DMT family transporter [Actinomycetales bacterium]
MTTTHGSGAVRQDRTWMVALAASLWGSSALMREPLLGMGFSASVIVVAEHAVLVLCLLPWLGAALRAFGRASASAKVCVVVIGAGSSALATTLFTAAFGVGDPITPQVLQKLQPVFALLLAVVLLGERLRRRFWLFAVPAVVGAWLLAFPDPAHVDVRSVQAALLAVGAAALWAAGTVLGRRVAAELSATEVTALRFGFGLLAMLVIVTVKGDWATLQTQDLSLRALVLVVLLALVPGLLALRLYYQGLQRTPASRATLAELAFPVTAAVVGVLVLDRTLAVSQWFGFAVVLLSVTALVLHETGSRRPAVAAPDRADEAVAVG